MARKLTAVVLPDDPVLRELVRIRNLLMLDLLVRKGFSSEDLDIAVHMGSSEIRRSLPVRELKQALKKAEPA